MYLGIDNNTGLIYEGTGGADIPAIPTPAVTQATLVEGCPPMRSHGCFARTHSTR
jgi:hypothetical protein